jgi:sialate O-acetylesterase
MIMKRIIILLLLIPAICASAQLQLRLPSILSNHAVLQRSAMVKLWGWGPGSMKVSIVCGWDRSDTLHVPIGADCAWETSVKTPGAGGPYSIEFICDKQKLTIDDILLGEVWLCSGQSNMEFNFHWGITDAGDALSTCDNKEIRFFQVQQSYDAYPQTDCRGEWKVCNAGSVADFSCMGYFFGRKLNAAAKSPVGLIGSYWGGTCIQTWMPQEVFGEDTALRQMNRRIGAYGWAPEAPSLLYNAMIHPILSYKMAGAIWYQGEANVFSEPDDYGKLFTGLIRGWRKAFQQDLPFYFVQIAPWNGYAGIQSAFLREQQEEALDLPQTGMISVGDLVENVGNIHPTQKREAGERLANLVLKEQYGFNYLRPYSPRFAGLTIHKNEAIIRVIPAGLKNNGKIIRNFSMAGSDSLFYPAEAHLEKDGTISVTCPKVAAPVSVRYCFTNDGTPSLSDSNGLPLLPFRTDGPMNTGRTPYPVADGTFIQEGLVSTWDDARWQQELHALKDLGMHYLVFAPTLRTNRNDTTTVNYRSSLPGVRRKYAADLVENCLRNAAKAGFKVFLGLNFDERWWGQFSAQWLYGQMEMGNRVADELVKKYKRRYGKTMYGWYWVWEVDNVHPNTDAMRDTLAAAMNINLDHLHAITPSMPFMLCPFMNFRLGTSRENEELWTYVFARTHFKPGDIFAPQDGIGAGGLELDRLQDWYGRLRKAVDTKPGLLYWSDAETFDQRFWTSAPLDRFIRQMDLVRPFTSNVISFAYSHYYSPFKVNGAYHEAYLYYVRNGRLPSFRAPDPVSGVAIVSHADHTIFTLSWNRPNLRKEVAGFYVFRNGKLVGNNQYNKEGECGTTYTEKEILPKGVYHYEVCSYTCTGMMSAKKGLDWNREGAL